MRFLTARPASVLFRFLGWLSLVLLCFASPSPLAAQVTPPTEKVFAHLDKRVYAAGERLYAALYLVDGQTLRPDTNSTVIYVELRDPNGRVIGRRQVQSTTGHAAADFQLPAGLRPGTYQITAYTNYQRNDVAGRLFQTPVQIVSGLPERGRPEMSDATPAISTLTSTGGEVRLRFFPEGGDCVVGLPCKVAVLAEDAGGAPVRVKGFLRKDGAKDPGPFLATNENGIGTVIYRPLLGVPTRVYLPGREEGYAMPPPLEEGYGLAIKRGRDSLTLYARTNAAEGLAGAQLTVTVRGNRLRIPALPSAQVAAVGIHQDSLLAGLYTATLFGADAEPVAERLFFIAPGQDNMVLVTDRERYRPRDSVELRVAMPAGRISYSVIPVAAQAGPFQEDIRSWLLLNSELPEPIAALPAFFAESRDYVRDVYIDDFLLTRGWRRFVRKPNEATGQDAFRREVGLYLDGRLTRLGSNGSGRAGKVWFTSVPGGFQTTTLTDEEGYFSFGPFTSFDTLNVILQGRFRSGRKNFNDDISLDDNRAVDIEIKQPDSPALPLRRWVNPMDTTTQNAGDDYLSVSTRALSVARSYDSLIIDLATIDVTGRRVNKAEEEREERAGIYSSPDSRIVADSSSLATGAISFVDFLRMEPGLTISGPPFQPIIRIRGISSLSLSNEPAYFLDGVQTDVNALATVPVVDIDFIDVFKGASAAILGSRGAAGAIMLYTRRGGSGNSVRQPGVVDISFPGYHVAREFATFDADAPGNSNRPDYRTTLHWNPLLFTGGNGLVRDGFTASDDRGRFLVLAQGLTVRGRPYVGLAEFLVE